MPSSARWSSPPRRATFSPDAEGFIRNWLVLAPIAIEGESGATEIDKDFLRGEATIKPKADEKVNVGGKILTWKAHQTADYFIDFLQAFGRSAASTWPATPWRTSSPTRR